MKKEGREGGVNHPKASFVELQFITYLRLGGLERRLSRSSRVKVVELQTVRDHAAAREGGRRSSGLGLYGRRDGTGENAQANLDGVRDEGQRVGHGDGVE